MALTADPHTIVASRNRTERLGAQEYHLVLLNTENAGLTFAVKSAELKIGKASDNDIVLLDATVSRTHLLLKRQGDRFLVQDLGSTNGTFIDGAQIREGFLRPGSVLEVGEVQLRFQPLLTPMEIAPVPEHRLGTLVGKSEVMRQIFALLQRIAPSESTLLLVGETGCGKGEAAKAIHQMSTRKDGPFVVFDCAAVSQTLIESELFGHEKGAFTGAIAQRIGCLERAHKGTLFIDEIDDLALELQPKLLRALEERELRRLGSSSNVSFDARIIAASKKDLWAEAQAARFREDLFFRLSVFTVSLPPLRDRREDIPLLVDSFAGTTLFEQLPEPLREQFLAHTWPGNVRELRNAIERARHISDLPGLTAEALFPDLGSAMGPAGDMLPANYAGQFKAAKDELVRSFEREYLTRLLARCRGNITKGAREAGLDRKHLYSLLHKYGLVQTDAEG